MSVKLGSVCVHLVVRSRCTRAHTMSFILGPYLRRNSGREDGKRSDIIALGSQSSMMTKFPSMQQQQARSASEAVASV